LREQKKTSRKERERIRFIKRERGDPVRKLRPTRTLCFSSPKEWASDSWQKSTEYRQNQIYAGGKDVTSKEAPGGRSPKRVEYPPRKSTKKKGNSVKKVEKGARKKGLKKEARPHVIPRFGGGESMSRNKEKNRQPKTSRKRGETMKSKKEE